MTAISESRQQRRESDQRHVARVIRQFADKIDAGDAIVYDVETVTLPNGDKGVVFITERASNAKP